MDWGAPAELRATLDGAPAPADLVWISTEDFYFGEPVVLGTGPAITTAALRPGTTTVEARLARANGAVVDRADVSVRYRESWNVVELGRLEYPAGTVGDVWVSEDIAYLARRGAGGISIVALDGAPHEIARFPLEERLTQDVHVSNGVAAVANDRGGPTVALLDVSDPTRPRLVGSVPYEMAANAHTVFLRGDLLSIAVTNFGILQLIDVSEPSAPVRLGVVQAENAQSHEPHVRGSILFGSYMPRRTGQMGELTIADVSDPARPVVLSRIHYENAFTHSSWTSEDGAVLYVVDETVNAPIRIYDVSDPTAPEPVGRYQPRLGSVPHHVLVRGALGYISHYKNGLEVVDLSDPRRPRLLGFFDTHPGEASDSDDGFPGGPSDPIFQGAWGVHWTSDGRIVVSDMERGLFLLRFTGS